MGKKNDLRAHQTDLAEFMDELTDFCHDGMHEHHISVIELCGCLDAIKFMYFAEGEKFAKEAAEAIDEAEAAGDDIEQVIEALDELLGILGRERQ